MADLLTVEAGVAAVAGLTAAGGLTVAWRMRRRALRAEARLASLGAELRAERHAASHDSLTGLPNRRAFYELGATLVADAPRRPLIAVVLDLDDFKQINDSFGHAAGDQVLITVAQRFAVFAGDNLVARLGGDEFAGLLTMPTVDARWLDHAGRRLMSTLAAPIQVSGRSLRVTASVGLAPVTAATHLGEVLHRADAAMYRVKSVGAPTATYHLVDTSLRVEA